MDRHLPSLTRLRQIVNSLDIESDEDGHESATDSGRGPPMVSAQINAMGNVRPGWEDEATRESKPAQILGFWSSRPRYDDTFCSVGWKEHQSTFLVIVHCSR